MPRIVDPVIPPRHKWNKIIFVGEAPGRQEDELGKPFVGRAGKLLDSMTRQAGIKRSRSIIINPFLVRPPNNKLKFFFQGTAYGKVKPEYSKHLKKFQRVLQAHQPAIIIAMGRTALWALSNYTGVLNQRFGKIMLSDYGIIICLYHPAMFLRTKDEVLMMQQIKFMKMAAIMAKCLL